MANAVGVYNGNFRGGMYYEYRKQIEANTKRQALEAARKLRGMTIDVCQEIRDQMTQAEYDAWWEAAPDMNFFEYACDWLLLMKTQEQEGAEPSPYISGGEVCWPIQIVNDIEIPF